MQRRSHTQRGFTLVELLTSLAIGGILAATAMPALGQLLARVRGTNTEMVLTTSLQRARTAAILHNARVLVCPSRDGRRCTPGGDWQRGWVIALDADRDGQPDEGAGLLYRQGDLPASVHLAGAASRAKLTFHPDGSAPGSNVTFTLCHAGAARATTIVLSNAGRVRQAPAEPKRTRDCLAALR